MNYIGKEDEKITGLYLTSNEKEGTVGIIIETKYDDYKFCVCYNPYKICGIEMLESDNTMVNICIKQDDVYINKNVDNPYKKELFESYYLKQIEVCPTIPRFEDSIYSKVYCQKITLKNKEINNDIIYHIIVYFI